MESIRSHYAVHGVSAISPSRQSSKEREVHVEPQNANHEIKTSPDTSEKQQSPMKRISKMDMSAAPKRRKTDAMGNKVELKSSGSRLDLNAALKSVPNNTTSSKPTVNAPRDHQKRPVAKVRTPSRVGIPSRLDAHMRPPSRAEGFAKMPSVSRTGSKTDDVDTSSSKLESLPRSVSKSEGLSHPGTVHRSKPDDKHMAPPSRSASSLSVSRQVPRVPSSRSVSSMATSRPLPHPPQSNSRLPKLDEPDSNAQSHLTSSTASSAAAIQARADQLSPSKSLSRSQSVSRIPTVTTASMSRTTGERPHSILLSSSSSMRNLKGRSMIPRSTSISSLRDPDTGNTKTSRVVSAPARMQHTTGCTGSASAARRSVNRDSAGNGIEEE